MSTASTRSRRNSSGKAQRSTSRNQNASSNNASANSQTTEEVGNMEIILYDRANSRASSTRASKRSSLGRRGGNNSIQQRKNSSSSSTQTSLASHEEIANELLNTVLQFYPVEKNNERLNIALMHAAEIASSVIQNQYTNYRSLMLNKKVEILKKDIEIFNMVDDDRRKDAGLPMMRATIQMIQLPNSVNSLQMNNVNYDIRVREWIQDRAMTLESPDRAAFVWPIANSFRTPTMASFQNDMQVLLFIYADKLLYTDLNELVIQVQDLFNKLETDAYSLTFEEERKEMALLGLDQEMLEFKRERHMQQGVNVHGLVLTTNDNTNVYAFDAKKDTLIEPPFVYPAMKVIEAMSNAWNLEDGSNLLNYAPTETLIVEMALTTIPKSTRQRNASPSRKNTSSSTRTSSPYRTRNTRTR